MNDQSSFVLRMGAHFDWLDARQRALESACFAVVMLTMLVYSGVWFCLFVFLAFVGMEWRALRNMSKAERKGGGPDLPRWDSIRAYWP